MNVPALGLQASKFGLLLVLCLAVAAPSRAEEAAKPEKGPPKDCKVTKVERKTDPLDTKITDEDKRTVQLGDTIRVTVEKLSDLRDYAQREKQEIILFLDDHPVKKATEFPPTDPGENVLHFQLKRNEDSRDLWTRLLGSPPYTRFRPVKVSVGLEKGYAIPSEAPTLKLWIIPGGWVFAWFVLMAGLLGLFLWCAVTTDVLRDFGKQPADGTTRKPFSLARVQAAWWFFLVLASYLFIGTITGDFDTTITESVLVLMGISAATVVGSAVVDATKTTSPSEANQTVVSKDKLEGVKASVNTLNQEIAALPADARGPKQQELAAKLAEQAVLESEVSKLSNHTENFFVDILSDIHGVSFHRFQILAWTLILGIIFIFDVYKDLAMPHFDNNLLMLMGISAGTYVGLKIPEQNTPLATAAATAPPAGAVAQVAVAAAPVVVPAAIPHVAAVAPAAAPGSPAAPAAPVAPIVPAPAAPAPPAPVAAGAAAAPPAPSPPSPQTR